MELIPGQALDACLLELAVGLVSLLCLFHFRLNPTWLILAGALVGVLRWWLAGS